jgi:hypothetical protein
VGVNGCYGFWRFNLCSPAVSNMLSVSGLVFFGLQDSLRSGARNEARIVSVVATGEEPL